MPINDSKINNFIYLDNAASTPIDKEVIDEMLPYMTCNYGNPSSLHKLGRYSRQGILNSRFKVSKLIGCNISEVHFTSGGTESNNLALTGCANVIKKTKQRCNQIIVSEIEHDSILETVSNIGKEMEFNVDYVPVNKDGLVNEEIFKELISSETALISIMLVNNEIGTIQPIKKLSEIAKNKNKKVVFHTDAIQALGKVPLNVKDLGIDMLSISAHKINGPKGAGALYVKMGVNLEPIIFGGGQENRLRSGTENVQSIAGFGKACEVATTKLEANKNRIKEIQGYAIKRITNEIPFSKLNGSKKQRVPNNINFSFQGINGEDLLIKLDENEIALSTGSACTSNKKQKASHVLKALGLSHQEVTGSIRLSLGHQNTIEELDTTITKLKEIISELRSLNEFEFESKQNTKTTIQRQNERF